MTVNGGGWVGVSGEPNRDGPIASFVVRDSVDACACVRESIHEEISNKSFQY